MSRIGKKPIVIPKEIKLEIKDRSISVEGPKGKLSRQINPGFLLEEKEGWYKINYEDDKEGWVSAEYCSKE